MRKVAAEKYPFVREEVDRARGAASASPTIRSSSSGSSELGDDEVISTYTDGPFIDLCRGPHVPDTSRLKHFKLTAHAPARTGAATRSARCCSASTAPRSSRRTSWTRTSTASRRRRSATTACSASELDLFMLHPFSPGAVFWTERGTTLYNALNDFVRERQRDDFHEIKTPLLYNKALWEISGHWGKYQENMFLVLDNETGEHDFSLKPMNCPSHYLLYSVEEALVPRAAAALRHVRRAAPQRGDGRAVGPHARAAVPAGRLPRLPARGPDRGRGAVPRASSSSATTRRSASRRRLKFATRPETAHRRRRDVGSRRGGAARARSRRRAWSTSSSRATARSTARRSTSTSPTRSAAPWQLGTIQLDYSDPGALRPHVRRRGQRRAPSGDHPPRGERLARAVHRDPDRALRRRVPGVARAGAGARAADHRRLPRRTPSRSTKRLHDAGVRVASRRALARRSSIASPRARG